MGLWNFVRLGKLRNSTQKMVQVARTCPITINHCKKKRFKRLSYALNNSLNIHTQELYALRY